MKLADLQAEMFSAATAREPVSAVVKQLVGNSDAASVEERINAYRANVDGAHLNALDQAFPVVREVLGVRYWQHLLSEEIHTVVSTAADLHAYGAFVPGLLRAAQSRRPELADMPYLADLATLEWRVHCARFAADGPGFDWQAFTALPAASQSRACFQLSPALSLYRPEYPVDEIWHTHQAAAIPTADCPWPAVCCIHRSGRFDVSVTRLSADSADILAALAGGASLDLLANMSSETETMIHTLYQCIQRGWIVGFRCADAVG